MTGAEAMVIVSMMGTAYQIQANQKAQRQQRRANREAKKIADRNAQRIEAETQEKARRTSMQQGRAESRALAKAAASGVSLEGSPDNYLAFMGEEHARQLGWLRKSGRSRAELAQMKGKHSAAQGRARLAGMRAQAASDVVSGAGQTYTWGSRADWWGD